MFGMKEKWDNYLPLEKMSRDINFQVLFTCNTFLLHKYFLHAPKIYTVNIIVNVIYHYEIILLMENEKQ